MFIHTHISIYAVTTSNEKESLKLKESKEDNTGVLERKRKGNYVIVL